MDYDLIDQLNFAEKVDRSLRLIREAYKQHGDGLVVAHSLGKDSCTVWDLVKREVPRARGFIVTTRYKPPATKAFMEQMTARYPELEVFDNKIELPDRLYETDPNRCCELLKVRPTRVAIKQLGATCWVTGIRCTEGLTRVDLEEVEERDKGLIKLNPILLWEEREVWQYLALRQVSVNLLYAQGYRSLGCLPCSTKSAGGAERAGRWKGTSKCGGECGIHTRPLIDTPEERKET